MTPRLPPEVVDFLKMLAEFYPEQSRRQMHKEAKWVSPRAFAKILKTPTIGKGEIRVIKWLKDEFLDVYVESEHQKRMRHTAWEIVRAQVARSDEDWTLHIYSLLRLRHQALIQQGSLSEQEEAQKKRLEKMLTLADEEIFI